MSDSSNQYPNNVIPQYRSPRPISPDGSVPCIKCPPDLSIKSVLFNCNSIAVVKGSDVLGEIDLTEWFVNVHDHFLYEFTLGAGAVDQTLNYSPVGDSDGPRLVIIVPQYLRTGLNQPNWNIRWRFTGESEYRDLGRILVLSSIPTNPVEVIQLSNPQADPVPVKILIAT